MSDVFKYEHKLFDNFNVFTGHFMANRTSGSSEIKFYNVYKIKIKFLQFILVEIHLLLFH